MGVYTKLAEDVEEVDIIIAGGGTASCVLATRLAQADPELSILIIEGGTNNWQMPCVIHPALYLQNLAPTSQTAIFYKGNPAPELGGREPIVPAGGILGGGSSINFMVYVRAQRDDFDSWKEPGWSTEELMPFLKKVETFHGKGNAKTHGSSGPINISKGTYRATAVEDDFLSAAASVGWSTVEDLQSMDDCDGFERWERYVSPDGVRQDAAHRYLHPLLLSGEAPNVRVVVESQVQRVVIDEASRRAVGVEYAPNPAFQASINLTQTPKRTVRARKLVVLASGACGSAPILERSGVGDPAVLERAGVPLVESLPGVGRDYQDHQLTLYPFRTNLKPEETLDDIYSGRSDVGAMIENKDRRLGTNHIDIFGKLRPTEAEVAAMGPEFQRAWDRDFKDAPNRPLMLNGLINGFMGDHASVPAGQYATVANYTAYPYSRGHVHITGPSTGDRLDFNPGFLTDPEDLDLKKQVWAYKRLREVMRRTRMYRGEVAAGNPAFPEGSAAACVETEGPLEGEVKDLVYSAEDDRAIEKWVRDTIATTWHALGTCKMGAREDNGVVDASLNVHGIRGLKVCDISVPPKNVGANTNYTALTIGEKSADIIIRELKLGTAA